MAKTKILLEIDQELLNAVQKQANENERSRSAEMRHIIKNGLKVNKRVK